jgi:hypothetical protein
MIRSVRLLALATGVLFAATAAIDVPHAQHTSGFTGVLDYLLEVAFSLSLATGALTLLRVSTSQPTRTRRVVVGVPTAGYAVLAGVTAATAAAGRDVLGPLFVLGLLLVLGGTLALAVLDLARRAEPRGVGLALLLGVLVMVVLGEGYGLLGWSAGWFAVAALAGTAQGRSGRQSEATTTSTRWNSLTSV